MRESAHKFSQKVLGEAGVRLASTGFILLLARHLGAENFGRYSSAFAFASIAVIFVDLGTNAILTREIARDPSQKGHLASASHLLKIAAALGAWLILAAATVVLKFRPEQRFLTLCLAVVVIGQTLTDYFSALLNGIEEMGWEAVLKSLCRVLSLSLGFIALALRQPLPVIVACMASGSIAGYGLAVWIVRLRFRTFGLRFDKAFLRSLMQSSAPLLASTSFLILYDSQDILLLNYFHFPQKSIGWFSAAMKIVDVLRVYPVLIMSVFFPTLSKLYVTDLPAFKLKQRRLMVFVTGTLCLLAGALYLLSPWMIGVIYKSDFAPASGFLRLLLPALVLLGINFIQSQMLIALNQERKLLSGAILACAVNLVLACLFLPRWGVPGTCYAFFGSEIIFFLYLRKELSKAV